MGNKKYRKKKKDEEVDSKMVGLLKIWFNNNFFSKAILGI